MKIKVEKVRTWVPQGSRNGSPNHIKIDEKTHLVTASAAKADFGVPGSIWGYPPPDENVSKNTQKNVFKSIKIRKQIPPKNDSSVRPQTEVFLEIQKGGIWKASGKHLGDLGGSGRIWGHLGSIWQHLESIWEPLDASWRHLEASGSHLGDLGSAGAHKEDLKGRRVKN